jgi:hypothetical protein
MAHAYDVRFGPKAGIFGYEMKCPLSRKPDMSGKLFQIRSATPPTSYLAPFCVPSEPAVVPSRLPV